MEGNESEYLENVMKREELISLEIQERIGDKHVLLIGANPENLGSALAVIAAMNDAAIISVADINPSVVDFAEQLAERFPKVKINGFKADVTSQGSMDQLMTDCAAIGKIDFVVDLAAIFTIGREQDIPAKDLEKAREVDVDGSKNVILAAQKLENVPLVTLTSSIAIYFPKMKGVGNYPSDKLAVFDLSTQYSGVAVIIAGFIQTDAFERTSTYVEGVSIDQAMQFLPRRPKVIAPMELYTAAKVILEQLGEETIYVPRWLERAIPLLENLPRFAQSPMNHLVAGGINLQVLKNRLLRRSKES